MLIDIELHGQPKVFALLCALCMTTAYLFPETAGAQAHHNVELLAQLEYPERASDIWGYVDDEGREYAIVGIYNGTSIVDVSEPTQPLEVAWLPGDFSVWRDIKTWQHYAYIINEEGGGLQIVDLSGLPDAVSGTYAWTGGIWQDSLLAYQTAHSIFIDSVGIGYLSGADVGNGGALMIDIAANPTNPSIVGIYDQAYAHDVYVRGNTLYTAEIYNGWFGVVDISDKANPVLLATQTTPNDFTHNIALDNGGTHLFTTDEKKGAFIAAYDISDLGDISETDRYQSNPGSNVIPHNVFYLGHHLVNAYYRDGVTLVDASRPHNLVETGYYDTSPLSGNSYNGCWGVYPFLPSGILLASDIEGGLFVLEPDYVPACHLEGTVSDAGTGAPLPGVSVEIAGLPYNSGLSGFGGGYATGTADAGEYEVTFFLYGYEPQTVAVDLENGTLTDLDVQLQPATPFTLNVNIVDGSTGAAIPEAIVNVNDAWVQSDAVSDAGGSAQIQLYYAGEHTITLSKWGHVTQRFAVDVAGEMSVDAVLAPGYYDDFATDLGWTVEGGAERGIWERTEPKEVLFNTVAVQPLYENIFDIGQQCYLTGGIDNLFDNVGGGDGVTALVSPAFDLGGYQNPILRFERWWYTQYAFADTLEVSIESGGAKTVLLQINGTDPYMSQWRAEEFVLNDYLMPSANMQLLVRAVDSPGSLGIVEAAFDVFEIVEGPVPPLAGFDALTPTEGCGPLTVSFANTSQNADAILWTFEGGGIFQTNLENPSVTYATPGTYDVSLSVSNGLGTDELVLEDFITVHSPPEAAVLVSEDALCLGDTLVLTAESAGALSFQWQLPDGGGETAQTFQHSPEIGGQYALTVTDANGCTAVGNADVTVNVLPQFSLEIPAGAVCLGEEVTFAAIGAAGAYGFAWVAPDGETAAGEEASFVVAGGGVYTVTATDEATGCTLSQSFEVTATQAQAGFVADVQAVCLGEMVQLASDSQNAGSFAWEVTNTLSGNVVAGTGEVLELVLDEAGTYDVSLVASGCGADELTMPGFLTVFGLPQVSASASAAAVCPGDTVVLSASGGAETYTWLLGGEVVGSGTELEVVVDQTSAYMLVGADANGCEAEAGLVVTASSAVNPPVAAFEMLSGGDICLGDTVWFANQSLNADSALWQWGSGLYEVYSTDDTPRFAPELAGSYDLLLTAYGCDTAVVGSGLDVFEVHQSPMPEIEGNLNSCVGGAYRKLSVVGTYGQYLWSDGSTAPEIWTTAAGEYCVTVTDGSMACAGWVCVEVVEVYPAAVAACEPEYQLLCEGEAAVVDMPGYGYAEWDDGSTAVPLVWQNPPPGIHDFAATVTDANGCTATASATIEVEVCNGLEYGTDVFQSLGVYPNPNAGVFSIAGHLPDGAGEELGVSVFDVLGRRVWRQSFGGQSGAFAVEVTLPNRAAGLYFAEVLWGGGRKVLRFAVD